MTQAKTFGVGTAAGFLGSLIGLGGGFVAVPLLTGTLKLTQHQAHGTSLAAVTATGTFGALSYGSVGSVDVIAAMAIACGGMLTAPLGARFAHSLNSARLGLCMGGMQLAIAPMLQLRPSREEMALQTKEAAPGVKPENLDPVYLSKMAAVGCFSGFMAGLFGIGGGAVVVPAISFLTDHSHHTAIGTSLAAMVLPSAAGSLTHYRLGNLIPSAAIPLAIGTATGAAVGAQIVSTIPEEPLKWIFSAFMLFLGSKAVIKAM